VLGPHRSGTSAFARIVNLLGVDLGPDDQLNGPGSPQNLKGFYESLPIMALNDRLLEQLGGSWRQPPRLASGWERDRALDGIRAQAAETLRTVFGTAPLWGFKDPRTCLTLPFWQELIGPAQYVICHRNPLEVARSLRRRDGIAPREALDLWARQIASAINATAGARRIFVGYAELFADRDRALGDLAAFTKVRGGEIEAPVRAHIDSWLDADLRHHTFSLADLLADRDAPDAVRLLAMALELALGARAEKGSLHGLQDGPGTTEAALNAAAQRYELERLADSQRGAATRHLGRVPWRDAPVARHGDAADGAGAATGDVGSPTVSLGTLAAALADALAAGRGYSMIRLGPTELRVLGAGARSAAAERVERMSAADPSPTTHELRRAIARADAVGLPTHNGRPATSLAELLGNQKLQQPLGFDSELVYPLLGFEPATGRSAGAQVLRELLGERPVACVGPLARDAQRFSDLIRFNVTLTVELDGPSDLDAAFTALAAARDGYDAVLVAAGTSAGILCSRLARELDTVAVDLGRGLDRLLYVRYPGLTLGGAEARWAAECYIRDAAKAPPDPPHPLEGELIREQGGRAVFLVERGAARHVTHKALIAHLRLRPSEVSPEELAALPRGLPLGLIQSHGAGQLYLLIGGRSVPVRLGLPGPTIASSAVEDLPGAEPLDWFPGASVEAR
jgi:hypothetical protein